ncbi:MAG: DAPG hydrolase family protein [Acutalibacteraceae bacterium]
MKELLDKPLPEIPNNIKEKLDDPQITLTPFEKRNEILCDSALLQEVGFKQFESGDWLVSMTCPMPGITPEMIRWWFWWHCQEDLRYQIWFPGAHFGISYNKKNQAYFKQKTLPEFQPNTHYPVERIGKSKMPLRIDFVTEEDFGFSRKLMEENAIPLIVCGHVSVLNGLIPHTEMAHIFKQTDDGLVLISRFWLGKTMNPLLRKIVMTKDMARSMAEHCCVEYRNLAQILPQLYQKYYIEQK